MSGLPGVILPSVNGRRLPNIMPPERHLGCFILPSIIGITLSETCFSFRAAAFCLRNSLKSESVKTEGERDRQGSCALANICGRFPGSLRLAPSSSSYSTGYTPN